MDAPFPFDEVEVVVSDQHLSAGKTLRVRVRHTLRYQAHRLWRILSGHDEPPDTVEVPNPLEDFRFDDEFDAFLRKIVTAYGAADVLRLRLMGDCFDPLAVTWRGKLVDPPYEAVGAYKMRQIILGHSHYFDTLAWFIGQPNARLDIFVGNHDQFLCWPKVQRLIVRRLAGRNAVLAERIRFVDQSMRFRDVHRRVKHYHGMNAEPFNSIHPETTILYERYGVRLKRPVLNQPLGTDMAVRLSNRIKLWNAHVGRLRSEKQIWRYAAKFKWMWGLVTGLVLLGYLLSHQVAVLWDWRRKTGIMAMLRLMLTRLREVLAVVASTASTNPVDAHAERELREDNERGDRIDAIIMGHSHGPCLVKTRHGTYMNVGTWVGKVRFAERSMPLRWRRFRSMEWLWRSFQHVMETGKLTFSRQLLKLIGFVGAMAAMLAFLLTSFQVNRFQLLSYDVNDFKLPVAILLGFLVVGGAFRAFAVRPDEVDDTRLTFGLIRHGRDGSLTVDLKEYKPDTGAIPDYI